MTDSEAYISILNSNFFFKEFTFAKNKFKIKNKGEEFELADNIIWLDNLLLIEQIKEREITSDTDSNKWFKNKVLHKAIRQVKDTINYFEIYSDILIENEKGHVLNISEAKKIEPIKLIIYAPGEGFSDTNRFQKFYKSKQVGLIHLFHIEDYLWICKYLVTPFEIKEYFIFRESLFKFHGVTINDYPEQYVLSHYIETDKDLGINPTYIKNLIGIENDIEKFDISHILNNFQRIIRYSTGPNHYYYVIKELAKLNRGDLRAFRLRYDLALKKAKEQEFDIPYRMTSLNSNCGFVFIPLEYDKKAKWKNALNNFSLIHKYEQKLEKVVGMVCYFNSKKRYHDINWTYINSVWEYEEELEKIIINDFPLRSVKMEKIYRYFVKD